MITATVYIVIIVLLACMEKEIHVNVHKSLSDYNYALTNDVDGAYYWLRTCEYFTNNYPYEAQKLINMKEIHVDYVQENHGNMVAYVDMHLKDIVYVNQRYLEIEDEWKRQSVIAHELMHILGLPDHKKNFQEKDMKDDPIYKATRECFPQFISRGWP